MPSNLVSCKSQIVHACEIDFLHKTPIPPNGRTNLYTELVIHSTDRVCFKSFMNRKQ